MNYTTVTNLKYGNAANTFIECTVNFEGLGEVPYTCTDNADIPHEKEIYDRCMAGDFGSIAAFEAPEMSVSELIADTILPLYNEYTEKKAGASWDTLSAEKQQEWEDYAAALLSLEADNPSAAVVWENDTHVLTGCTLPTKP